MKSAWRYLVWLLCAPVVVVGFVATWIWLSLLAGCLQAGRVVEWLEA